MTGGGDTPNKGLQLTKGRAELTQQAFLARSEGRLEDARALFVQAVSLCRSSGDSTALVEALKALGQFERDQGRVGDALTLYGEAAAVSRREGSALILAHTVRHIGDIHQDADRLEMASLSYQEALAIYRGLEAVPTLELANALRPLAILRERTGAVEEAKLLWMEAVALYAVANVREGVVEGEARLAELGKQ